MAAAGIFDHQKIMRAVKTAVAGATIIAGIADGNNTHFVAGARALALNDASTINPLDIDVLNQRCTFITHKSDQTGVGARFIPAMVAGDSGNADLTKTCGYSRHGFDGNTCDCAIPENSIPERRHCPAASAEDSNPDACIVNTDIPNRRSFFRPDDHDSSVRHIVALLHTANSSLGGKFERDVLDPDVFVKKARSVGSIQSLVCLD